MKEAFLEIAACPGCGGELRLANARAARGGEISGGALICRGCDKKYPIRSGVPYFVDDAEYSRSFGLEWNFFRRVQIDSAHDRESEETFSRKTGWDEDSLDGLDVLDAGCGAGRFTDVASRWGATVFGIDMSSAVHAAYENAGRRKNVHIARADIFHLPFRAASFDRAFSIGVLPFVPDPAAGFSRIPPLVKPGGRIAIWTYGTHDEEFIRKAELFREVTSKMPHLALLGATLLSAPAYHAYRNPTFIKTAEKLGIELPYIPMYPDWRKRWLDTFDFYSPKYQDMRGSYSRVAEWFESAGLDDIRFLPSDTSVTGRVPSGPRDDSFLDNIKFLRASIPGRELILYGTGAAGRAAFEKFTAAGARIPAFASTSPAAPASKFMGLNVLTPNEISSKHPGALIAICSEPGYPEIAKTLSSLALSEWSDFVYYSYLL